jgi:hypothetical protein
MSALPNRLAKVITFFIPVPTWRRKTRDHITHIITAKLRDSAAKREWKKYIDWVQNHQLDKSKFVPLATDSYERRPDDAKLIAYYLPQYYPFPQNDAWFGKGFTEWSNAAKAVPQYAGHWQPHLPIDMGFYSLETTQVMRRQVELAKQYGIYGFCFYYYWFGGNRLMDKPVQNLLNDTSIDMPFCLFWANETWSKNWGPKHETGEKAYDANVNPGDGQRFYEDIAPFFNDARYIKIDDRPVLIIYRTYDKGLPKFIEEIGAACKSANAMPPYLMIIEDDNRLIDPRSIGADAAAEFFNYSLTKKPSPRTNVAVVNPKARLKVFDMESYITNGGHNQINSEAGYPIYRGAVTRYDNTARKVYTDATVYDITPPLYSRWLKDVLDWTKHHHPAPQNFAFVSAWNEWAEAMHLEPDQKYGYAYLAATRDAIEAARKDSK